MAKKKKANTLPAKKDILTVTDISTLGSDADPCFGKEYNLSTPECKRCGDSEMCAIKFAQLMNLTREQVEKENTFKDMESTVDTETIKKYMRGLKRKGAEKKEIITKSLDKFGLEKKEIRSIYRQLK